MSFQPFREHYRTILDEIRASGQWKEEQRITTPQRPGLEVATAAGDLRPALNLCANNYLGLADHPEVIKAAVETLGRYGYGLASVRFICGTQDLHVELEEALSGFLSTDETILYSSCFDANGALFECLLDKEDVVLSDGLNHASVIDGIRLSRATRRIFRHADLADLRAGLEESREARVRLIVTDGVFSMHGDVAPLAGICELAEEYRALVVVDDSHATGVLGRGGRGTPEHAGVADKVDLITSTLGKALGGATGGFATGKKELVALLRQRSRPYLFSNSVSPATLGGALKALEILGSEPERLDRLRENTRFFRAEMARRDFRIGDGEHPIVPIMIGDEKRTVEMARSLFERGLYVVGFTYPVVPRGEARIRVQISAAHTTADLQRAVEAFAAVRDEKAGPDAGA